MTADTKDMAPMRTALKKIRNAWIAAVISGSLTLALVLLAFYAPRWNALGINAWALIDVAFIYLMAFGIYRKSRTCAVLMLVYFTISKAIMMVQMGKPSGILLSLAFFYFFANGVAGTFAYHKLGREPSADASPAA